MKLNSKIRWSKATALLTVAVALLIGMGAAPAMANSPLTKTSSCFTGGCHSYTDFAAWHTAHQAGTAGCSTCHTTAPAMKSTADACDPCHEGEVAAHSTRSAGCSTCHHDPVATFTLTYTAGSNGSIVGSSTQVVNSGSAGTAVTATPNSGYHWVSWSDGVATATRTDTNVTGNITASATFAANPVGTFTLTYTAGSNGSIVGSSTQVVNSGSAGTAVTATPNSGYHWVSWSDGVATATRTDTNVTGNITASATFAADADGAGPFTITASAGAGGLIAPSGATTVAAGSGGTWTITPNSGYHVLDVTDNSVSKGALTSYTLSDVTADHIISATFAANPVGKISTSLTIRTTRTSAYIGQTFILSGLARPTPGMIGQNMEVYVKKPGKSYWTYTSRRTIYVGPSGTAEWWFRYYLDPNKVASGLVRRGTYLFKAVYNGDATYAASQSTIISVLVR